MSTAPSRHSPATAEEFAAAAGVSADAAARFEAWRQLLATWSARINLVGASTLGDFWSRHALDSAQLAAWAETPNARWIDLGSGAGFPGLAVALVRADRRISGPPIALVEANGKKAAFLREAGRITGASVDVVAARAETLPAGGADVVTARAFAPLPDLFAHMHRLGGGESETTGLFLKGRTVDHEIAAARKLWSFDLNLRESAAGDDSWVVRVTNLAPKSAPS